MIEELKDIKVLMHNQYEAIGKKIGEEFFIPITLLEKGYDLEKEWLNTKNTLKIHVTKKRFLAIDHYDYQGNYLHYDRNRVENWNVEFHHGIPKTVYPYGKYFNPSTIAQYGLQHYSLYLKTRDLESKQKFLRVADWFVSHQNAYGGWPYQFDLHYYPNRLKEKIKAPWYSAIGLGMSMSVLVRATVLTKDRKYERCALRATPIFNIPSEKMEY
ncbi:MAG: hypothetical protein HLX49_02625 [Virgibacillus sp.]|nr:D-glucuronyl C5-epimerase family protein [Virgibacillus sp.]NWO12522.1 hypothetical protein [Virgibacillus sp.]